VSGNQGDRYSKRDREYARSMGRDPSDTFDAEILPYGQTRPLEQCLYCDDLIRKERKFGFTYFAHPDRYGVDDNGIQCADGEHDAEPCPF
jgi:hypothetical protein